jgi:hypothetical protein
MPRLGLLPPPPRPGPFALSLPKGVFYREILLDSLMVLLICSFILCIIIAATATAPVFWSAVAAISAICIVLIVML